MLEIVNSGTNNAGKDWHSIWKSSAEFNEVQNEIDRIHVKTLHKQSIESDASLYAEFAVPFVVQLQAVILEVFQQYWRMPGYVLAKWALGIASGLFIGFTFYGANGMQAGMQNILFSVFMLTMIFSTLVQQVCPVPHDKSQN